jgi:RNA polymerase sigma-70 factor (ECF subfamily)
LEINPNITPDAELLNAARQGDQRAFSQLMDKYKESLQYMILKIVKSPQDAEDLLIESFAKAFDNLDKYTPQFAFSTWLYKIASNTCIDFLRKKSIQQVSMDTEEGSIADNLLFSSEDTPEQRLIRSQRIDMLQESVKKLDPAFRQVIALRFFDEKSYEEISQELHIPIGTVKVQLFRAKKQLQEIIKNDLSRF